MRERWEQLTRREQWALMAGGVILALIFLLRWLWWPLLSHIEGLHEAIDVESELITWMAPRVGLIPRDRDASVPKSVSQLERSLQEQGLQSYTEDLTVGEHGRVSIRFQAIPMPLFVHWLDGQKRTGWMVEQATLTPVQKAGLGDITLVLQ